MEDRTGRGETGAAAPGGAPFAGRGRWDALYRSKDTAERYERRFTGRRRWNNRWIWRAVRAELRRAAGGGWPATVVDAPAGTGRFTRELQAAGVRLLNLDSSPAMLATLQSRHGPGRCVVADLRAPALAEHPGTVALCLRLMQHLDRPDRVAVLAGLRRMAAHAVVAYYPGWHLKSLGRRLRHRLGLPHRALREVLRSAEIEQEAAEAGWRLRRIRPVLPLFSENVLILLEAKE